jgi:prefoldin subunit 5
MSEPTTADLVKLIETMNNNITNLQQQMTTLQRE